MIIDDCTLVVYGILYHIEVPGSRFRLRSWAAPSREKRVPGKGGREEEGGRVQGGVWDSGSARERKAVRGREQGKRRKLVKP